MRVLVVEDETRQAEAIRRGLEAEGIAVNIAATGTDGLWMATTNPYDLILLDVMLPGMNGFRVCAELRKREVWTPILVLTAKEGEYDEAEALDTGADDFLSKPFSFVVLLARIRALTRRGAMARPTTLSSGAVELDIAARRCTVDGVLVELTGRELSILQYLMRRAGDVVPKSDIRENVWDQVQDINDNVVEVHVSALRRKLGADAIETVRGGGYRMERRRAPRVEQHANSSE